MLSSVGIMTYMWYAAYNIYELLYYQAIIKGFVILLPNGRPLGAGGLA